MGNIKPTLREPMSPQSEKFEKDFSKTMVNNNLNIHETDVELTEVDKNLDNNQFSLKKKIFSLQKMESLVFSDPKLSSIYDSMADEGESKYGYHYNETIQNIIFNDYVLNSPKYLQKYKMAIPKEKKRRDKSGINQLKKAGAKKMTQSGLASLEKSDVSETDTEVDSNTTKVIFLVNDKNKQDIDLFAYFPELKYSDRYMTGYSNVGQHSAVHPDYANESREATPEEYSGLKTELEGIGYNLEVLNGIHESTSAGSAGGAAGYTGYAGPAAWSKKGNLMERGKSFEKIKKPIWNGGTIIQETNYLTDSSGFEKYVDGLNEQTDADFILNNSDAYGSVDNMNPENQKIIKNDINSGKMNNNSNIKDGIALQNEAVSQDMYSTKEDLAHLVKMVKERTGKGIGKDHIPMLAGEALYSVAIQLANRILDLNWDDFGDTNSMWDYIDENGGMTYDELINGVKEACNDRVVDNGGDLFETNSVEKLNELSVHDTVQYDSDMDGETKFKMPDGTEWVYVKAIYPDGKKDIGVYRFGHDLVYDYEKWMEAYNINGNNIKEDMQSMIQNNGTSMSNKAQATDDQGGNVPMGTQSTGGMNETDENLFEEINKELNAFSIHQDNLKNMDEDRKTSSMILKDRVGGENSANFKKDLKHSGTKEIIDVEKEMMWKDQQTDIGNNPHKLSGDIEKQAIKNTDAEGDEALKNVGDSANDNGDEIPKRNATTTEQEEIDLYRNGLHSTVFDNEPGERYEDRMKADMGDKVYNMREKQLEFKGKAPMYNKDTQPMEDGDEKSQFDRNKSGWNDREALKESMITGRYIDSLGERRLIEFRLIEANVVDTHGDMFSLDFTGLGNTYNNKTVNKKVVINETVVSVLSSHKFYTNGNEVIAIVNPVENLNETDLKIKPIINEGFNKMKHLFNYNPNSFTNTGNIKKNRGF